MTLEELKKRATTSELTLIERAFEEGRNSAPPPWVYRQGHARELEIQLTDVVNSHLRNPRPDAMREMFKDIGATVRKWVEEAPSDDGPA